MADKAAEFVQQLKEAGVRVTSDTRDNYTPGWKYNHWELKVSQPLSPNPLGLSRWLSWVAHAMACLGPFFFTHQFCATSCLMA